MNQHIRFGRRSIVSALLLLTALLATGCSPTQPFYFFEDGDLSHYVGMATNIEYPDVNTCSLQEVDDPPAPFTHQQSQIRRDLGFEAGRRRAHRPGKRQSNALLGCPLVHYAEHGPHANHQHA